MRNRLSSLVTTSVLALASSAAFAQSPLPASKATDSSDQATGFVRAYAASIGDHEVVARWVDPICVRVVGLEAAQAAALKARVEAVAKQVGVRLQSANCQRADIEVAFTDDAQHLLDDAFKAGGELLGDAPSARTITLPIQAWYVTNDAHVAENDPGHLKALADNRADRPAGLKTQVLYQGPQSPPPELSGTYGRNAPGYGGGYLYQQDYWQSHFPAISRDDGTPRAWGQFLNAFIIVDTKRTAGVTVEAVGDYLGMLALSQSKSLGECQALPSITDLFATCRGRPAPEGLTAADTAYLHALYAADHSVWGAYRLARLADVVRAMAPRLAGDKVAAR